ncbi:MAG: cell division protein SepF [Clostridiales bacterium]|jgi:FtsZ-interacting cell division protein YlmF|nr:cell division protein SepF [Clostridiales bacterium]
MGRYNDFLFKGQVNEDDLEYIEDVALKPRLNPSFSRTPPAQKTQRPMSSVVIHSPTTPDEVESLIDYLRRREPAIVNLDKPPVEIAQRILDMLSGAIYALNGSMHRIQDNIFLLTPEGVEIAAPGEELK